jgi:hypothetical protein
VATSPETMDARSGIWTVVDFESTDRTCVTSTYPSEYTLRFRDSLEYARVAGVAAMRTTAKARRTSPGRFKPLDSMRT